MKVDRLAKQVPVDAPWTATRAAEWDQRTVADFVARSGIQKGIGADLFEMAVRGLFTGGLEDTSFLHLLFLVRAHGSINTLFSIENGAQENLVDGGFGSIAAKMAGDLGDAVRLSSPVRTISQRDDRVDGRCRGPRGHRTPRRGHDPARARRRDRVRARAARRPAHAVSQLGRGAGVQDPRRLRRAVLACRRLQRPDRGSRIRVRGDDRRVALVRDARCARVVHVRAGGVTASTRSNPPSDGRWSSTP